MLRRNFLKNLFIAAASFSLPVKIAFAKNYLTIEQAKQIIWPDITLTSTPVILTEEQAELIEDLSDIRVRNLTINAWKTPSDDWFIVDQVIGKHENIDLAIGINHKGEVTGIEVLTYRETYGDQIMHPKWRAQFFGKNSSEHLKLDKQIKNISGATLSCRHVTDGINRLTQTWTQVLSKL
jgi:Na+-translocating ferredoxin:NAD+ oxidoreductase RnfG subunit